MKPVSSFLIQGLLVVAAVVLTRLVPHPYNFTPLSAVAVYSGLRSDKIWKAGFLTFAALLVSDALVMSTIQRGFGTFQEYLMSFTGVGVYLAFLLLIALGRLQRHRAMPIVALSLCSSLLFYFVTNFFVWLSPNSGYPPNLSGLWACLYAGIPFYRGDIMGSFFFNQVWGDLFYFSLLFGFEYVLLRRWRMA
ncbi:MAG: hypothetical protein N2050_01625 [Flavobacteriales bacterium]|nr:hypothetical protein [Flavobacteriales bacterium]